MLEFALASAVLVMIPGSDQALITRNCLTDGRVAGLATALGGLVGVSCHALVAATGASAVLLASPTAFAVLKVAGVAYLAWLGVDAWRRASRVPRATDGPPQPTRSSPWRHMRQGWVSNALNVKILLFFVALLPQFLSPALGSPRTGALLLSGVFACTYLAWFSTYVLVVHGLGTHLRRPRTQAAIERITGLLLVGFALRLAITT